MVAFDGNILGLLDIIDTFQNGQSMANAGNAHAFQVIMLEGYQRFADDLVLCIDPSVFQFGLTHQHIRRKLTDECITILLQTNGANEVSTLLGSPFCNDSLGQAIGTGAMTVCGRCVLCGGRQLGIDRRCLRIKYWGHVAHAALVLVVGVRLGVGRAALEVHCFNWEQREDRERLGDD